MIVYVVTGGWSYEDEQVYGVMPTAEAAIAFAHAQVGPRPDYWRITVAVVGGDEHGSEILGYGGRSDAETAARLKRLAQDAAKGVEG